MARLKRRNASTSPASSAAVTIVVMSALVAKYHAGNR
jgi:hypothetical protein